MGGGIRPESPKVATRRRAESRRPRSAVQRETTEWRVLIHQLRVSAPVQLRSSQPLRRTEPDQARPSPPRNPPLRVTINIIFSDQVSDLQANGSGRIQSAQPSMDMAGQNRKVPQVTSSEGRWDQLSGGSALRFNSVTIFTVCLSVMGKVTQLLCCAVPPGHWLACSPGRAQAAPTQVATSIL